MSEPAISMDCPDHLDQLCNDIAEELRDLAVQVSRKDLTQEQFVAAVLSIETAKVRGQGFTLSASNTRDDWTSFAIRRVGSRTACAAFEFLPETGEFRRAGDLSRYEVLA